MQNKEKLTKIGQSVNKIGVYVEQEVHGLPFQGIEIVIPHVVLLVCLNGNARASYDKQETYLAIVQLFG